MTLPKKNLTVYSFPLVEWDGKMKKTFPSPKNGQGKVVRSSFTLLSFEVFTSLQESTFSLINI